MTSKPANRLAHETSPYLLQHAHNPVDWYPWGDEALERARAQDKPLLVSIGYAACHWCHVMERESFEDPEVARLMNDWFVNIKVDREERPDLDSVYMSAVQAMTGHGGWPMTVFCTPDGMPFWGGTYFPPEDRHGLPSFRRVLAAINDAWATKRDDIREQGAGLLDYIQRATRLRAAETRPDEQVLGQAARAIISEHDDEWGGFGSAPKFPQPMTLEFLLRMHLRGVDGALQAVTTTLDRMARGGIFDHLAGGFARYSTDRLWLVPHFEKMLYDNGQLVRLYARAWQVTGSALYERAARMTADWMIAEMQQPSGGFSSSLDADSEGAEGRFYVWTYEEIIEVAGDDMPLAVAAFALAGTGNWEGKTVLWRPHTDEEVAEQTGVAVDEVRAAVGRVTAALLQRRAGRVRPATDDKVLASWNGLAIAGLAELGRISGDRRYVDAAERAADAVLTLMRPDGRRLHRSWRAGRTSGPGYLDDYACMADACLTLYETTFDPRWYDEATTLARDLLDLFTDEQNGGFFDTGTDVASPVVRPKDLFDNAMPSGGSAAADVLLRLFALSGEQTFERHAEAFLRLVGGAIQHSPLGFGNALCALDRLLSEPVEVAVIGPLDDAATKALLGVVHAEFRPNTVVAAGPGGERPELLSGRTVLGGRPAAYVCRRFACRAPVTDPHDLAAELAGRQAGAV